MSNGAGDLSYRMTMEEDASPKLAAVAAATDQVTASANKTATAAQVMAAALSRSSASTALAASASQEASKGFDQSGVSLNGMKSAALLASHSISRVAGSVQQATPAAKGFADSIMILGQGIGALATGVLGLVGLLTSLAVVMINLIITGMQKAANALADADDRMRKMAESTKKANDEKLDKIIDQFDKLKDAADRAAAASAKMAAAQSSLSSAKRDKAAAQTDIAEQNELAKLAPGDKAGRDAVRKKYAGVRLQDDVNAANAEAADATAAAESQLQSAQQKKTVMQDELSAMYQQRAGLLGTRDDYEQNGQKDSYKIKANREAIDAMNEAISTKQDALAGQNESMKPMRVNATAAAQKQLAVELSGSAALKDFANKSAEEIAAATVDALKTHLNKQKEEIKTAGSDKIASLGKQIDATEKRLDDANKKYDEAKKVVDKWSGKTSQFGMAKSDAADDAEKLAKQESTAQDRMRRLMDDARKRMRFSTELRGEDVTDLNKDQLRKLGLTKRDARDLSGYMSADKDLKANQAQYAIAELAKKEAENKKAELEKARDKILEDTKTAVQAIDAKLEDALK